MQGAVDWLVANKDAIGAFAAIFGVSAVLVGALWKMWPGKAPRRDRSISVGSITTQNGHVNFGRDQVNLTIRSSDEIARMLLRRNEMLNRELGELVEERKALVAAIDDLKARQVEATSDASIEEALAELERGDTGAAERLFRKAAKKAGAEGGRAYRHLGAIAYLHDPQKALDAYRKATELDPENLEGWIELGNVLRRLGQLGEAERTYGKVLKLAKTSADREAWPPPTATWVSSTSRGGSLTELKKRSTRHSRWAPNSTGTLGWQPGTAT